MALKYKLVQRGNPSNPEDLKKYYANAVNSGDITLRQLANEISEISTVSTVDTMAVIESLLQVIPKHVIEGKIVRLGDFGSFGVRLSSEGANSEGGFKSSMLKKLKMYFRPGKLIENVLSEAQMVKE